MIKKIVVLFCVRAEEQKVDFASWTGDTNAMLRFRCTRNFGIETNTISFGFSVHLKLGLSVSDFVEKVKNVKIMEASTPRTK